MLSDVTLFDKTIFDIADYTVSNIMLPIGAMGVALFTSFRMKKAALYEEIKRGSNLKYGIFQAWFFLLRYVVPILILFVMIDVIGIW